MPYAGYNGTDAYRKDSVAPVSEVPVTIAGWYYGPSFSSGEEYVAGIYNSGNDTDYFALYFDGSLLHDPPYAIHNGVAVGSAGHEQNKYNHMAGVFVSATDRWIYVNGVGTQSTANSGTTSGLDRISFARYDGLTPGIYYGGMTAEWGVWNVALTSGEVSALAYGLPPILIRPQNLIRWYPMYMQLSADPIAELIGGYNLDEGAGFMAPSQSLGPTMVYPESAQLNIFTDQTIIGAGPFPMFNPQISQ